MDHATCENYEFSIYIKTLHNFYIKILYCTVLHCTTLYCTIIKYILHIYELHPSHNISDNIIHSLPSIYWETLLDLGIGVTNVLIDKAVIFYFNKDINIIFIVYLGVYRFE